MHRLRTALLLAAGLPVAIVATVATAEGASDDGTSPIVVRVDRGFGWTEAGLGALAGAGAVIAVGGAIALVRRDPAQPPSNEEPPDGN